MAHDYFNFRSVKFNTYLLKISKNSKGNIFNLVKDMFQNLKQTFNGKTSDVCHVRSGIRQTWLTLLDISCYWTFWPVC